MPESMEIDQVKSCCGVTIQAAPLGQKETRPEHIVSEKHNIGHKELYWIKKAVAFHFGEADPEKICDSHGKKYVCVEVLNPQSNKRYHVEIDRRGIVNAWVPSKACGKKDAHIKSVTYGKFNKESKRFHHVTGPLKGKFAKGSYGKPKGFVTDNSQRNKWKDPTSGSDRVSPFLKQKSSKTTGSSCKGNPPVLPMRSDHSLISGYAVQEASTHQKLLGVETCLKKDMSVSHDALGFMYSQRSASYKKGRWNNTGEETVQLPFVQYSRKGAATIDSAGLVQLSDGAEITDYSLSDVTKNSIRQTANFLHDRNIHNLDAGMREILDGAWMCAKSASMDEFTHGFVSAMKNRGYPTSQISMAVNLVGKPLWRAYQTYGQKGFAQAVQHSFQDLLAAAAHATERPVEFVLSCVNSAAPLLGIDLNVQWNEDYKGFRIMGYGLGVGRQIDVGKNGFVEDTGIHGSYRFPCTRNIVGEKLSVASAPLFGSFCLWLKL